MNNDYRKVYFDFDSTDKNDNTIMFLKSSSPLINVSLKKDCSDIFQQVESHISYCEENNLRVPSLNINAPNDPKTFLFPLGIEEEENQPQSFSLEIDPDKIVDKILEQTWDDLVAAVTSEVVDYFEGVDDGGDQQM